MTYEPLRWDLRHFEITFFRLKFDFRGISSSFFEIAAKQGKNIIPIAFSELELEYCDILNSNRNVYDAVEYCNNMIKNNERN